MRLLEAQDLSLRPEDQLTVLPHPQRAAVELQPQALAPDLPSYPLPWPVFGVQMVLPAAALRRD